MDDETLSRRELFQAVPRAALILSGINQETPVKPFLPKIYHSGDVIDDPAGQFPLRNWRVGFNPAQLANYSIQTGNSLRLKMIDARHKNRSEIQFEPKTALKPSMDLTPPPFFVALPESREGLVFLHLAEFNANKLRRAAIYQIEVDLHEDTTEIPFIYSELPLGSSNKEKIRAIGSAFTPFGASEPIYIIDSPGRLAGVPPSLREGLFVEVSSSGWLSPDFDGEGEISLFHQLCYSIQKTATISAYARMMDAYLQDTYERTLDGLNPYSQVSPRDQIRVVKNHPILAIFDESSYCHQTTVDDNSGDALSAKDHREFIASLFTTLRFFPEAFIERYSLLPTSSKQAVVRFCQYSLNYLANLHPLQDNRYEDVIRLLPSYPLIRGLVELEKTTSKPIEVIVPPLTS